jgi:hypothetical protein
VRARSGEPPKRLQPHKAPCAIAGIPASKLRSLATQAGSLDAENLKKDTLPERRYTLIVALLNRMRGARP